VSHKGNIEVIQLPEGGDLGYGGYRAKFLYVPGHYDALYE